jgi:hypothetical protein
VVCATASSEGGRLRTASATSSAGRLGVVPGSTDAGHELDASCLAVAEETVLVGMVPNLTDSRGRTRIIRSVYEACVFQALRERLRCKEIWVVGAHEWRNPDEDLPTDFETHRVEHYDKLHKPLDPAAFTAQLREEMRTELAALTDALPKLDWLRITDRKSGAIKLTPLDAQPETRNLRRLKKAVQGVRVAWRLGVRNVPISSGGRYRSVGSRGLRYSEICCAAGGSMFASTATT